MYKYSDLNTTFFVKRLNGDISFIVEKDGQEMEVAHPLEKDYPLYNLGKIQSDDNRTIFLCEDEEVADCLNNVGYVATTFCHENTDFTPLKEKKIVVISGEGMLPAYTILKESSYNAFFIQLPAQVQDLEEQELITLIEREKPSVKTVDLADLSTLDFPKKKYILKPWLREATINIIFASTAVGKSQLAMIIGYCASTGNKIFNWEAPERRYKVLYYDAEMDSETEEKRMSTLMNTLPKDYNRNYLRFANLELQKENMLPSISTPEGRLEIEESIKDAEILILDNLSSMFTGEENNSESWSDIRRWFIKLRSKRITLIVLHHTNKSKTDYRGHSSIVDNPDELILLTHPPGYTKKEGTRFNLSFEKCRNMWGEDAAPIQVYLEETNGVKEWKYRDEEAMIYYDWNRLLEKCKLLANRNNDIPFVRWLSANGISMDEYKKILTEAKALGVVRFSGGTNNWYLNQFKD